MEVLATDSLTDHLWGRKKEREKVMFMVSGDADVDDECDLSTERE